MPSMLLVLYTLCRVFFVPHTLFFSFFFNDTATTEIYTLSLHDALPISRSRCRRGRGCRGCASPCGRSHRRDRKSTRLNSSHPSISYAVFCLKKKKNTREISKPLTRTSR